MSDEVALEELRRCAGTQFDPVVVNALVAELTAPLTAAQRLAERQHIALLMACAPSISARDGQATTLLPEVCGGGRETRDGAAAIAAAPDGFSAAAAQFGRLISNV
jgi:hypothetical protein